MTALLPDNLLLVEDAKQRILLHNPWLNAFYCTCPVAFGLTFQGTSICYTVTSFIL
jgi:hypothetical protein